MSEPTLKLIMVIEDADDMGTPLKNPRRIVRLTQDGKITTFLAHSGGPPIIILKNDYLGPDEFQKAWAFHTEHSAEGRAESE